MINIVYSLDQTFILQVIKLFTIYMILAIVIFWKHGLKNSVVQRANILKVIVTSLLYLSEENIIINASLWPWKVNNIPITKTLKLSLTIARRIVLYCLH